MKLWLRITTSLVSLVFVPILVVAVIQLHFYNVLPNDLFLADYNNTYFGISSLFSMSQDFDTLTSLFFDSFNYLLNDYINSISSIFDSNGYFYELESQARQWLIDFGTGDIIANTLSSWVSVFRFVLVIFYPFVLLITFMTYLVSPLFAVLLIFIKALMGVYNLPIPRRPDYIIPNWHEVWDFTYNLKLLLF